MTKIQKFFLSRRSILLGNVITFFLLLGLALIPVTEIIIRLFFGSGLIWSNMLMSYLVIWLAWIGGVIASRDNAHLFLSTPGKREKSSRSLIHYIKEIFGSGINIAFGISSVSFILIVFNASELVGIIPIRLILIVLPVGFFLMGLFSVRLSHNPYWKLFAALLTGLILGWPALVNIIAAQSPDISLIFSGSVEIWYEVFRWLRWPLIILLLFLGSRGLPIYLMLGGTALFLFSGNWGSLEILPNESYNLIKGNTIAAIPLFTIAGFILSESGSGTRLVRFFQAALGWLPGGLAVVVVISCAYFTTFTGASGVTILALGGLLSHVMVESGQYKQDFSLGLITSSGSIGLLFPPALPIIMYSVAAQINIKDMFKAGFLPGLILVITLSLMGVFQAQDHKKSRLAFNSVEFVRALGGAFWELFLPLFLLVVYFTGITNLIETAATAVVYNILLCFFKGDLSKKMLLRTIQKAVPVIGGVLIILALAKTLSYYIVDAQVPMLFTAFFREYISSRFVFLILLNAALLITGAMIDIYSAILVVAPLIIPLGELYGVHPVQLGIIFLANLQLGYLTPPVGMNLFLASYTFDKPLASIYKQVAPFLLVLLVAVLLITYVPWFSLVFIQ